MNKVSKAIMTFFSWFSTTKWWTFWSNIRFKNSERSDVDLLYTEDFAYNVKEIKSLTRRIYDKFNYTKDGANQLWDAITPPPQNYLNYINGVVNDDCDGFHSTLYHCLHKSNIECYLMSVSGIGSGHCVLVFRLNNLWHVVDYTIVYSGHKNLSDAIKEYNSSYKKIYGYKKEFLYNAIIKYDYDKKKFIGFSLKDIENE